MNGRGRGMGGGRGRRRGQTGGGYGRMTGASPLGRPDSCVCPNCGQTETHKPGVPCLKLKCPNCGSTMTRQ